MKSGTCAVLVYTSGTTGVSKGVMISHDNLFALDLNIGDDMIKPNMKLISYLPCSHIAALSLDVFMAFTHGACCYFAGKDALKGELLFYL